MAHHRGPKTITYNIDVLYDTLNEKSYVGEPTTNLVSNNPTFIGQLGTQTNTVTTSWVFSGIGPERNGFAYYDNTNSPIPLKFPNEGAVITPWRDTETTYSSNRRIYQYLNISPNTEYTISHWFYRSHGVGAGCAIFQYSDNFSTYVGGEYLTGYDSVSNAGEWTLYEQTFTSLPTAVSIIIGPVISWITESLFAMQRFQIEQKSHRSNFTIGSRSSTQGLIDLSRNKTINLSNASFTSNSLPSFDGTNDYITLSPRRQYGTNERWTAELIVNPQNTTQTSWNGIFGGDLNGGGYWMFHGGGQLAYYEGVYGGNANLAYTGLGLGSIFPSNTNTHLVITYDGTGNYVIYVNGVVATSYNFGFGGSYSLDLQRIGGPADRFGTVDVSYFKMYSATLTATQVDLNYQALKSRL
jgi:hypothetical protein